MGMRRKGREAALQMLYQMDASGGSAEGVAHLFWGHLSRSSKNAFADQIVQAFGAERANIDQRIRDVSHHWRLERMSRVDRNIIRLGAYELMYCEDIPSRVTINEAVELAKRYGSEGSTSFVNGVLDRMATEYAGQKQDTQKQVTQKQDIKRAE